VRQYASVFWRKYNQLAEWEKIIQNIERGEAKITRRQEMCDALAEKVARYNDPLMQLTISYGPHKTRQQYTVEEDQFLVCMTHQLGYGNWEELKLSVRKSWQFRFDWFLKSRSPLELGRRVDILIRLIEKESQELRDEELRQKKEAAAKKRKEAQTNGLAKSKSASLSSKKSPPTKKESGTKSTNTLPATTKNKSEKSSTSSKSATPSSSNKSQKKSSNRDSSPTTTTAEVSGADENNEDDIHSGRKRKTPDRLTVGSPVSKKGKLS